jgi:hypothetical protein
VSGFGRILVVGAFLAGGLGIAGLRAQTVLGDPRDAARTFASNCSACHKSPQGLAKSGQVAGFLRQHYTTGPEMSAAMAAYLVAAGNAPAGKKGAATADTAVAQKTKSKKGEQLAAHPSAEQIPDAMQQRTLRGKQRPTKSHEEPTPQPAPAAQSAAEEAKPAASAALNMTSAPAEAATPPPPPPPVVLDIPLPPMPDAPPPELSQSVFASSPLP